MTPNTTLFFVEGGTAHVGVDQALDGALFDVVGTKIAPELKLLQLWIFQRTVNNEVSGGLAGYFEIFVAR
jgi:hypothetical protein